MSRYLDEVNANGRPDDDEIMLPEEREYAPADDDPTRDTSHAFAFADDVSKAQPKPTWTSHQFLEFAKNQAIFQRCGDAKNGESWNAVLFHSGCSVQGIQTKEHAVQLLAEQLSARLASYEEGIAKRLGDARRLAAQFQESQDTQAKRDYATWAIRSIFDGSALPCHGHLKSGGASEGLTTRQAKYIHLQLQRLFDAAFRPREEVV